VIYSVEMKAPIHDGLMCVHVRMCICMKESDIYIYIERERDREKQCITVASQYLFHGSKDSYNVLVFCVVTPCSLVGGFKQFRESLNWIWKQMC
jgi:hypothetical protein